MTKRARAGMTIGLRQRGFRARIAGDTAVPRPALLLHRPRQRAMQQAAIVPDDDIACRPAMVINARSLAGGGDELFEKTFGLAFRHAGNAVRVAADDERLASCLGMGLHERAKGHRAVVKAIAGIFAACARAMTELRLA